MDKDLKKWICQQFGASIDMLENAIELCPDFFWDTEKKFWYNAYHCLFYLDYYLTLDPVTFSPPKPFTLSEFDPGTMPERTYGKEELLSYLRHCRIKCRNLIADMTDEIARANWKKKDKDFSVLEVWLYNMRHVQHHAAQLNLLLRQEIDDAPPWVSQTKMPLE
jgi:hypothetical protein